MTQTTGRAALEKHLHGMTTDAAIAYIDDSVGKPLPRYVVQDAPGNAETITLRGETRAEVSIAVNVETEAGDYAATSRAMVAALEARFRPTTRITHDGVTVIIEKPVRVGSMPPMDGVHVVPVIIRGRLTY